LIGGARIRGGSPAERLETGIGSFALRTERGIGEMVNWGAKKRLRFNVPNGETKGPIRKGVNGTECYRVNVENTQTSKGK